MKLNLKVEIAVHILIEVVGLTEFIIHYYTQLNLIILAILEAILNSIHNFERAKLILESLHRCSVNKSLGQSDCLGGLFECDDGGMRDCERP